MVGKYLLLLLMVVHGLVHFLGWIKSIRPSWIATLSKSIQPEMGIGWLITGIVFLISAYLLWQNNENWWMVVLPAILFSTFLTYTYGPEAKAGSIVNLLLLLALFAGIGHWQYKQQYKKDVNSQLTQLSLSSKVKDTKVLPQPLLRYLDFCGLANMPVPRYIKLEFSGKMADGKGGWFPFTSQQYDFFEPYRRLFWMEGKMKGLTIPGYHKWEEGRGSMDVRLFGWFPVVHHEGKMMDESDAVTLLNDICLFAPNVLKNDAFTFEEIDETHTRVVFHYPGRSVKATLEFDNTGKLINFFSDDRYDVNKGKKFLFSTPISEYIQVDSIRTVKIGKAVWHYPEGEFPYGVFHLKNIETKAHK